MHSVFQLDCPRIGLRVVLPLALIIQLNGLGGWKLSGDLRAKPARPGENRFDYLCQEPPGLIPKVFAPGIVSTDNIEFKIAIAPDGATFYFTRHKGGRRTILFTERTANGWTDPKPVSFSGNYMDEYPTISPDGQRLFFQSTRPLPDSLKNHGFPGGFRFWRVTRSGDKWGEPEPLGARVNVGICISTVMLDGTIYFSGSSPSVIMKSFLQDGDYSDPIKLDAPINHDEHGSLAACLSPEEDYLVFASGRPGFGKSDLWVSFRNADGSWGEPRNLGHPVNTAAGESSPVISPDGKYLFYNSGGDIYWVDINIIDNLKHN